MARHLLPHGSGEDQYRLTRSISHAQVADLCTVIAGNSGAGNRHVRPMVEALRKDNDLVALCRLFIELQQARYDADYNHLVPIRKTTTLGHIADAERLLQLADKLTGTPNYESFLSLLALKAR
jgi:hypothetical protein